ncbi:MAG TPA: ABC transporter ATP-binding protein [Thermomicrobiales bacterium]|nr:ABC transporter ATP-binding protein [Thermomicrobiales bacterium]
MRDETIIEVRGLRKVYDTGAVRVEALKGVDLAVRRGEMVAIMGPSGCGKTTFLNCVSGLDRFDAGDVIIAGENLRALSDNRRTEYRARRMGFVFQSYNLLPVLSAAENVELPLLVGGTAPRQARARALRALDLVGLPDKAASRPAELSGGQRQRVTIARALVNDPAIVFADEPTGALDSESAGAIMDLLVRLNKAQGQTVVMVTHDAGVGARADRIVRFRDGAIVGEEVDLPTPATAPVFRAHLSPSLAT